MKYAACPNTLAREVGEELVLVNVESGRIFAANRTGAVLWQGIEQRDDLAQVIESLVSAAPDAVKARAEIAAFLDMLVAEKLVEADA